MRIQGCPFTEDRVCTPLETAAVHLVRAEERLNEAAGTFGEDEADRYYTAAHQVWWRLSEKEHREAPLWWGETPADIRAASLEWARIMVDYA